jgi:hypothetical protein
MIITIEKRANRRAYTTKGRMQKSLRAGLRKFCYEKCVIIGDADINIIVNNVFLQYPNQHDYSRIDCFNYLKRLAKNNEFGICYEKDFVF